MARILIFRYPECGFEVDVPMLDRQGKTALRRQVGPVVSRIHRRDCEVCRQRRREQFQDRMAAGRSKLMVTFQAGTG